jgi:AcrR family transcriptional regulator
MWQNSILMIQNKVPTEPRTGGVAERVAQRTLAARGSSYAEEVRRLLDAALAAMLRCGTTSSPRVADIVTEAGLSNEAFYRHFKSKADLVTALLEDGAERLRGYLAHQMDKERTPEAKMRRWVQGVLSQAEPGIAETTLAVLWNGGSVGIEQASGRHFASAPLAALLHEPLAALGSARPELHANLAAHATLGVLADHLWQRTQPSRREIDEITAFYLGR